ncbi:hypothetical protein M378DRAFT_173145 [Amanita muscaria Koide BX008]|uniref:Uncharacterized protein n=1 Tax=Amanita muscaria (strain Koide BX008) TaxID=946122 RepID=A0A0C2RZW4_AMAMK|nr:hypothetical protein M378DRAFT_173145 [Amanita muscaria Koide BX008]
MPRLSVAYRHREGFKCKFQARARVCTALFMARSTTSPARTLLTLINKATSTVFVE